MNELIQYVRGENGRLVGVMYAEPNGSVINIGWSKCNDKDKFDKKLGLTIAIQRSRAKYKLERDINGTQRYVNYVPLAMIKPLYSFYKRAERYYHSSAPYVTLTSKYRGKIEKEEPICCPKKVHDLLKTIDIATKEIRQVLATEQE